MRSSSARWVSGRVPCRRSSPRRLLAAVDDDSARVRLEAIYALGTVARGPVDDATAAGLIKALDHYDPAVREAAARVIGRLGVQSAGDALINAVNDSQASVRYAAMRALGSIRERRAVQALTDQLAFYGKGEGAVAALDALARIADPASVPLFTSGSPIATRTSAARAPKGSGARAIGQAWRRSKMAVINEPSDIVRAAMTFALQLSGRNDMPRLVEFLARDKVAPQVAGYLLELGPPAAPLLVPHLIDSSAAIRANVATILGSIGGPDTIAALQALTSDRDADVRQAVSRAIARIKMR